MSRVACILCEEPLLVFDRYPLVDGSFFLSPKQHSSGCIEVSNDPPSIYCIYTVPHAGIIMIYSSPWHLEWSKINVNIYSSCISFCAAIIYETSNVAWQPLAHPRPRRSFHSPTCPRELSAAISGRTTPSAATPILLIFPATGNCRQTPQFMTHLSQRNYASAQRRAGKNCSLQLAVSSMQFAILHFIWRDCTHDLRFHGLSLVSLRELCLSVSQPASQSRPFFPQLLGALN